MASPFETNYAIAITVKQLDQLVQLRDVLSSIKGLSGKGGFKITVDAAGLKQAINTAATEGARAGAQIVEKVAAAAGQSTAKSGGRTSSTELTRAVKELTAALKGGIQQRPSGSSGSSASAGRTADFKQDTTWQKLAAREKQLTDAAEEAKNMSEDTQIKIAQELDGVQEQLKGIEKSFQQTTQQSTRSLGGVADELKVFRKQLESVAKIIQDNIVTPLTKLADIDLSRVGRRRAGGRPSAGGSGISGGGDAGVVAGIDAIISESQVAQISQLRAHKASARSATRDAAIAQRQADRRAQLQKELEAEDATIRDKRKELKQKGLIYIPGGLPIEGGQRALTNELRNRAGRIALAGGQRDIREPLPVTFSIPGRGFESSAPAPLAGGGRYSGRRVPLSALDQAMYGQIVKQYDELVLELRHKTKQENLRREVAGLDTVSPEELRSRPNLGTIQGRTMGELQALQAKLDKARPAVEDVRGILAKGYRKFGFSDSTNPGGGTSSFITAGAIQKGDPAAVQAFLEKAHQLQGGNEALLARAVGKGYSQDKYKELRTKLQQRTERQLERIYGLPHSGPPVDDAVLNAVKEQSAPGISYGKAQRLLERLQGPRGSRGQGSIAQLEAFEKTGDAGVVATPGQATSLGKGAYRLGRSAYDLATALKSGQEPGKYLEDYKAQLARNPFLARQVLGIEDSANPSTDYASLTNAQGKLRKFRQVLSESTAKSDILHPFKKFAPAEYQFPSDEEILKHTVAFKDIDNFTYDIRTKFGLHKGAGDKVLDIGEGGISEDAFKIAGRGHAYDPRKHSRALALAEEARLLHANAAQGTPIPEGALEKIRAELNSLLPSSSGARPVRNPSENFVVGGAPGRNPWSLTQSEQAFFTGTEDRPGLLFSKVKYDRKTGEPIGVEPRPGGFEALERVLGGKLPFRTPGAEGQVILGNLPPGVAAGAVPGGSGGGSIGGSGTGAGGGFVGGPGLPGLVPSGGPIPVFVTNWPAGFAAGTPGGPRADLSDLAAQADRVAAGAAAAAKVSTPQARWLVSERKKKADEKAAADKAEREAKQAAKLAERDLLAQQAQVSAVLSQGTAPGSTPSADALRTVNDLYKQFRSYEGINRRLVRARSSYNAAVGVGKTPSAAAIGRLSDQQFGAQGDLNAAIGSAAQNVPGLFGQYAPELSSIQAIAVSRAAQEQLLTRRRALERQTVSPTASAGEVGAAKNALSLLPSEAELVQKIASHRQSETALSNSLQTRVRNQVEAIRTSEREQSVIEKLGLAFRRLAFYTGASFALYGAVNYVKQLAKEVGTLQEALAGIQGTLGSGPGALSRGELSAGVIGIATRYGVSAGTVAESVRGFAGTGIGGRAALEQARQVASGNTALGVPVDVLQELFTTLGSVTKGNLGGAPILDRIAKISGSGGGAVTAETLAASLTRVGALGQALQPNKTSGGLDFADIVLGATSSIARATRGGGGGAQIGGQLRQIFSRLLNPSSASELQDRFGIKLASNAGGTELRPLFDILRDLSDYYKHLITTNQTGRANELLVAVGGSRQTSVAEALLKDFSEAMGVASEGARGFGENAKREQLNLDTANKQLARFHEAMFNFTDSLIEKTGLLDTFTGVLKGLTPGVNGASGYPGTSVLGLGVGAIAAGGIAKGFAESIPEAEALGVLRGLSKLAGYIGEWGPIIGTIVALLGGAAIAAQLTKEHGNQPFDPLGVGAANAILQQGASRRSVPSGFYGPQDIGPNIHGIDYNNTIQSIIAGPSGPYAGGLGKAAGRIPFRSGLAYSAPDASKLRIKGGAQAAVRDKLLDAVLAYSTQRQTIEGTATQFRKAGVGFDLLGERQSAAQGFVSNLQGVLPGTYSEMVRTAEKYNQLRSGVGSEKPFKVVQGVNEPGYEEQSQTVKEVGVQYAQLQAAVHDLKTNKPQVFASLTKLQQGLINDILSKTKLTDPEEQKRVIASFVDFVREGTVELEKASTAVRARDAALANLEHQQRVSGIQFGAGQNLASIQSESDVRRYGTEFGAGAGIAAQVSGLGPARQRALAASQFGIQQQQQAAYAKYRLDPTQNSFLDYIKQVNLLTQKSNEEELQIDKDFEAKRKALTLEAIDRLFEAADRKVDVLVASATGGLHGVISGGYPGLRGPNNRIRLGELAGRVVGPFGQTALGQQTDTFTNALVGPHGLAEGPLHTLFGAKQTVDQQLAALDLDRQKQGLPPLSKVELDVARSRITRQTNRRDLISAGGELVGSFAGAALGQRRVRGRNTYASDFAPIGAAVGNLILPGVGGAIGGIAAGLFGSFFGKQQQAEINSLGLIERNTRETITAISNQTSQLLNLDNRLLNVPATFTVPSYRPLSIGSGGPVSQTINISIDGSKDAQSVARAVRDALSDESRRAGGFVSVR